MVDKLQTFAKSWLKEFKDVRSLGFVVFAIIALLVTWSTIGSIQTNYDLQKKVSRLEQENQVSSLENTNLKLKNQYYDTDQYLELAARKQFGKAAPGETVYVVPKSVALKYVTEQPKKATADIAAASAAQPAYQKNFQAWMQFLFRHGE